MLKSTADVSNLRAEFFDNVEIQFMLFDENLCITDVNESLSNYYRLTKNQLIGKHILDISPDIKEKGLYDKYKDVLATGKSIVIGDIQGDATYGNQHHKIKAFKVGGGLGVAVINITELRNTIDSLELFIIQSSHDMLSPIANINGLATIALEKTNTLEDMVNYCKIIKEQSLRMDSIIKALIETIKVKNTIKKNQLINFNTVIQEVKESIAFIDGFSNVQITENNFTTTEFYGDNFIVFSLFQNLVDNAIKYRNKNTSNPYVNITIADDVFGIKITVADNGIGIPENLQKNVFKMFFRGTQKKDSVGLGLYTVFSIVKKLNGHITFESKEMLGTTFFIYLPLVNEFSTLVDFVHQNQNYIA